MHKIMYGRVDTVEWKEGRNGWSAEVRGDGFWLTIYGDGEDGMPELREYVAVSVTPDVVTKPTGDDAA